MLGRHAQPGGEEIDSAEGAEEH